MANLIKKDESVEKALKVELPDGTEGEIPIRDATERGSILTGDFIPEFKHGGVIKKYDQGEEVRKEWVKEYEDRFKNPKAPMQKQAPSKKPRKREYSKPYKPKDKK